jgi:hypothetical protein
VGGTGGSGAGVAGEAGQAGQAGLGGTGSIGGDGGDGGDGGKAGSEPSLPSCTATVVPAGQQPTLVPPAGLSSLKRHQTSGLSPRITLSSCGVIAASNHGQSLELQYFDEPGTGYPIGLPSVQSIAMRGSSVFVLTTGDTLRTFRTPRGTDLSSYNPPFVEQLAEGGTYRSVAVSPQMVAWTGRQGNALVYTSVDGTCVPVEGMESCTKTVQVPATVGGTTTEPGWGVAFVGTYVWWLGPSGLHGIDTAKPSPSRTNVDLNNTVAGSLIALPSHLLFTQNERLVSQPLLTGDTVGAPTERSFPGLVFSDLVFVGHTVYALAGNSGEPNALLVTTTQGLTNDATTNGFQLVTIQVSSQLGPQSLAIGPDGAYFSVQDGSIYRIPAIEIAPLPGTD